MRGLKRRTEGFNLAFLDVMSCGLGAALLIFMLVKYQTEESDITTNALQAELASVQNENDAIEASNSAQSVRVEKQKQKLQRQLESVAQTYEENAATADEIITLAKEITRLQEKKIQLEQHIDEQKDSSAEKTRGKKTHAEHLLGLRVSGSRILILLDNSASMADERLADIIKIKVANTATKKSAPKWQRAIAIVQWILDRVPDKSTYMIINYNTKADFLSARKWIHSNDSVANANVLQALETLYPHAATNLHAALALVKTSAIAPTDIYLITDGLPTKGAKKCSIFASKTTVSGKCRLQLFQSAVHSFSGSARVNTVLLPIEGDPDAAAAYWQWAIATGGLMISPAGSWP